MDVGRPLEPVPLERGPGDRPEHTELVAGVDPLPLGNPELADHELLPARLLSFDIMREAERDRDGRLEVLALGD